MQEIKSNLRRFILSCGFFWKDKFFFYKTLLFSRYNNTPLIYVVGDSHTLSFRFYSPFITCHLGAVTAYNILKENSTTGSMKKLFSLTKKINFKKDFLLLVFGEIDCRIHVYRQFKKSKEHISIETIIDKTIDNYFVAINQLRELGLNIVIYGVPPANFQKNIYSYDYYAEPEVQVNIKKSFNEKLKVRCQQNGLKYLEVFYKFSDKDGFIRNEFSSDEIHLNEKIIPFVKDWFRKQISVE